LTIKKVGGIRNYMKTTKNTQQSVNNDKNLLTLKKGISALIKKSVKSFEKIPPQPMALGGVEGEGVFALYYTGEYPLYKGYKDANTSKLNAPIYISKGANIDEKIKEQYRNIAKVSNLNPEDFYTKVMPLSTDLPSITEEVEATLVDQYQPLWNTCLEGFGSHNPGRGRAKQAPSDWDVIHPGREWVSKLSGKANDRRKLGRKVQKHMKLVKEGVLK